MQTGLDISRPLIKVQSAKKYRGKCCQLVTPSILVKWRQRWRQCWRRKGFGRRAIDMIGLRQIIHDIADVQKHGCPGRERRWLLSVNFTRRHNSLRVTSQETNKPRYPYFLSLTFSLLLEEENWKAFQRKQQEETATLYVHTLTFIHYTIDCKRIHRLLCNRKFRIEFHFVYKNNTFILSVL